MTTLSISFLGLGLIGGSIAKSIRAVYPSASILAYDIHASSLSLGYEEGVLTKIFTSLDSELAKSDYVFLCSPIVENIKHLSFLGDHLSPTTIITDVGSVKSDIHQAVSNLSLDASFIGGHPMAGSEKMGYVNSSNRLLENAYYIATPTASMATDKVRAFVSFIASLGAIPLILKASEHDYVTAAISHLPHIIASSLVHLVKNSDSKEEVMKLIAAGGFKDITRIASSSPDMWQQISLTNQGNISSLLSDYISSLHQVEHYLQLGEKESLYDFFAIARDYRDSLGELSNSALQKTFGFYIDIPDKSGVIAKIVTLLAKVDINIKNIGIVNNREYEEGVLRIEFDEESISTRSKTLLISNGYTIYTRS